LVLVRTHDEAEAARLVAGGGNLRRVAHDMAAELTSAVQPEPGAMPAGIRLEALSTDPKAIAAAAAAATLPGHIDYGIWSGVDRAEYWRQLLAGEGPCGWVISAASRTVRDHEGEIVGTVAVTQMPESEWWAGDPWIPEIFVVSAYQGHGLGASLIGHAMRACVQGGKKRLGLTVTEGNPARRLYERFGFAPFRTTWLIDRRS
jgi:mycothiol synthase